VENVALIGSSTQEILDKGCLAGISQISGCKSRHRDFGIERGSVF
jgi:hypothetical protein